MTLFIRGVTYWLFDLIFMGQGSPIAAIKQLSEEELPARLLSATSFLHSNETMTQMVTSRYI